MSCEMASRKNKMNAAYHGFKHVLLDKRLAIHTRLELYNAIVIPNALYGCQVWNATVADISRLESLQLRHLRALLSQARHTPAVAVLTRARQYSDKVVPLECRIHQMQLRYVGHVVRMVSVKPAHYLRADTPT